MSPILGHAIVLLVLAFVVFLCIRQIVSDLKSGGCAGCSGNCSSCGGGCASCAGGCKQQTDPTKSITLKNANLN